MDPSLIARFVAGCRVAIGGAFVVAPQRFGPLWLGPRGREPGAHFLLRIVGARDLVLATGALAALRGRGGSPGPWILAGVAADACDLAATVAQRHELPPRAVANTVGVTAGGVALGLLAYRGQS